MTTALGEFDLGALDAALRAKRQALSMSWSDVARAVSTRLPNAPTTTVSASTIAGLAKRGAVEADGVLQMLLWLDRTPESFCVGHSAESALSPHLPPMRPGQTLRFDATAIYEAVATKREELGATWKTVAQEIGGHTPQMLTRLAKGGRVAFPGIMRVIVWTRQPATRFMRPSDA